MAMFRQEPTCPGHLVQAMFESKQDYNFPGSSNGRTRDSESRNLGSSPSPGATRDRDLRLNEVAFASSFPLQSRPAYPA